MVPTPNNPLHGHVGPNAKDNQALGQFTAQGQQPVSANVANRDVGA